MTKQSMAELVKYLGERGYVSVEPDPEDRRGRLVKLTARGQSVFQALTDASTKFEELCEARLGRPKWREFKALIREVATSLEPVQFPEKDGS